MPSPTTATALWRDYQKGMDYQISTGLSRKLPQYVRFFEGDQWPEPTPSNRSMPRPVLNLVKMICRNKKAAILSTPVRLLFEADDRFDRLGNLLAVDSRKFTDFASYVFDSLGQDELDKKAVRDGVIKGCYVYHYYWDAASPLRAGGSLACEIIDPLQVFFANPAEVDEQKQDWILIASRLPLGRARALCDLGVDPETVLPDEPNDPYRTTEPDERFVTVLTRYERIGGEVFCTRATKNVVLNAPFPLTPRPNGEAVSPMRLYPIVVGHYEEREKNIYGLGEVEGLIPNQKAINFNVAMMLLNLQDAAWGKYVVLPKALGSQAITNEPGQVLTDYTGTGNGIKRLADNARIDQPLSLVNQICTLTRTMTGSSEVMTGEMLGSNLSGSAIAQLQAQAELPIGDLRDAFWRAKEKQGLVVAEFLTHFYDKYAYTVEVSEGETKKKTSAFFSSCEFAGAGFRVRVRAVGGTRASEAGDIRALDTLLERGAIDLDAYLEAYPAEALRDKDALLRAVAKTRRSRKKTGENPVSDG